MDTAHARHTDPATSRVAAASVDPMPSQQAVLDVLADGEATDEQILDRIRRAALLERYPNWAPQRIRDARCALARAGYVRQATDGSGRPKIGTTERGGRCRVWVLSK